MRTGLFLYKTERSQIGSGKHEMTSAPALALQWIAYWLKSNSRHGTHSPFIYHLVEDILYKDDKKAPSFRAIEMIRSELLKDQSILELTDYGAGSRAGLGNTRTVSSIARNSAATPKYGRLLSRLAGEFGKGKILEAGTSLGIGTMYLAAGAPDAEICTLEGDPAVAELAQKNFETGEYRNIRVIPGPFAETLEHAMRSHGPFDLIYFDGDHRGEKLREYFLQMLPYTHNDTLLILDDIRWSESMHRAWMEITRHPSVTATVDLFFKGLVFFRKEQPRQYFLIRF